MCLFHLVTPLVTQFEDFKSFNDSTQACWRETVHPATRLEIVATCKHDCENGRIYLVNKTVLDPKATSFTLTGIMPGSQCQFTLKAVYNPASYNLDKGISATYMVLPKSRTSSHMHVSCKNIFTR